LPTTLPAPRVPSGFPPRATPAPRAGGLTRRPSGQTALYSEAGDPTAPSSGSTTLYIEAGSLTTPSSGQTTPNSESGGPAAPDLEVGGSNATQGSLITPAAAPSVDLPPRVWPTSSIAYVRRPRQLAVPLPADLTPAFLHRRPTSIMPITPPVNPHPMVTWAKDGFRLPHDRLTLVATATLTTSSAIPTSVRTALTDPNWHVAMEEEYGALMSNGTWDLVPSLVAPMSSPISGSSRASSYPTGLSTATRLVGSFGASLNAPC
jgi:hypothetical protein